MATRTTPAKIKKLRSRSDLAVLIAGASLSAGMGGTFISRLGSLRPGPAIAVVEPDDLFALRSGDLEDVGVLDRGQAMSRTRNDVQRVPRRHAVLAQRT